MDMVKLQMAVGKIDVNNITPQDKELIRKFSVMKNKPAYKRMIKYTATFRGEITPVIAMTVIRTIDEVMRLGWRYYSGEFGDDF